jgi:hypothetical protein
MAPTDPHDLYGLPLERFTEERNALSKRLRQDGRRDEAAEVTKLRKPSIGAWAVNQLVRTQRREVNGLFEAGDALQKAQADVLRGRGDSSALRGAADGERAALDALASKARGLLSSEGRELGAGTLEQVSETLHAAAVDKEARAQVRDGCLVRELRHVGLGTMGASGATGTGGAPRKSSKDPRPAQLRAARRAEGAARRELEHAERNVRAAEESRDRAASGLRDADETLAAARGLATEARAAHERSQRALDELG